MDIKALNVPGMTVTTVEQIPAGAYRPPGGTQVFENLPAFCRVTATITAAPGSSIGIEVWLPSSGWNGCYLQVGTHGLGGEITRTEMAPQLRRGFATSATDSGHAADHPFDSSWAIGSSPRIADFAWRSVHELAVKAKKIIAGHYRRPAAYAYYAGSSTGGRDGLKSAQMFPHDFDGILAGTAIQHFTRGATQMLVTSQRLSAAGFQGSHGTALLGLVHQSVVAAYGGVHGAAATMTEDPGTGQWDPHSLVRRVGQDTNAWLSREQADAVAASLAPLTDPVSHEVLFVGQPLASQQDWIDFILQPAYSLAVYRMGLNRADWDGSTFDLREDLPVVETRLGTVNATDPDLSAFMAAGGKIIQYQPWDDGVAYPQSIVNYYNAVLDRTTHGSRAAQQSFYRLFMMPGVSHTGSGPEPFNFGHGALPPVSSDPEHDAVAALRAWVEQGIVPSKFIATKYVNDDPNQGVAMQRVLCPYPGKAVYRGAGDPNDPINFTCGAPGAQGAPAELTAAG